LQAASFFGDHQGHWLTEVDEGQYELVQLVLDGEVDALAESRLFAAAIFLCRPADLGQGAAGPLRAGALAFAQAQVPLEVVATERPVSLLAWLAEHIPGLIACCQADGDVQPRSPSWWRERVRRHLTPGWLRRPPPRRTSPGSFARS
jgi:hypothetical protein